MLRLTISISLLLWVHFTMADTAWLKQSMDRIYRLIIRYGSHYKQATIEAVLKIKNLQIILATRFWAVMTGVSTIVFPKHKVLLTLLDTDIECNQNNGFKLTLLFNE